MPRLLCSQTNSTAMEATLNTLDAHMRAADAALGSVRKELPPALYNHVLRFLVQTGPMPQSHATLAIAARPACTRAASIVEGAALTVVNENIHFLLDSMEEIGQSGSISGPSIKCLACIVLGYNFHKSRRCAESVRSRWTNIGLANLEHNRERLSVEICSAICSKLPAWSLLATRTENSLLRALKKCV